MSKEGAVCRVGSLRVYTDISSKKFPEAAAHEPSVGSAWYCPEKEVEHGIRISKKNT